MTGSGRTAGLHRAATALGLGVVLLTGCAGNAAAPVTASSGASGFHGPEPDQRPPRASFVLQDLDGATYDFRQQTAGRPTLLYFGYTNCPDECPTAMADIAAALRTAPEALRAETTVVMVTTDPERDTPVAMRRFLDQFGTTFVGLVGTQAQVDAAQRAVGIEPAVREGDVPTVPGAPDQHVHAPGTAPHVHFGPLGYGVGHADVIFAYDAADELPVVYPGGSSPSDIAADLPLLARPRT